MSIRYRFVKGIGLASSIISLAGGGDNKKLGFSHVDIVLPDGTLFGARSDAIGGRPPGCWARPWPYEKVERECVLELPSTPAQERLLYTFLKQQTGKPYDTTAIWAFVVDRDWRQDDSWFCSELSAAATEYAGLCEKLVLPVNKISPTTWAVVVSALGGIAQ